MSMVRELREYLKVSGDPSDDRSKMFRSLVFSRMNEIINNEDTIVHNLNIDGKDCTNEWRKCISELKTKMSFELEFVFTYVSHFKYDKDGEVVDGNELLFALANELGQVPDSFLEDHQYIYHYMDECVYNDAGELRAYRKKSDLLQRGDLVEFVPVSASSITGDWYTDSTVLWLEEDEVPQNDDFLLFEEAFGMLYNYWNIGAEDVKTGTKYLVNGDLLKAGVNFTKAMNALMAVYLTSFDENKTMSYEFVSGDELSMLRVTFDLAEETINYELAKA